MKCAFIYNPNSGKCKKEKTINYIVSRLKTKYEVDVFRTEYPGHASLLSQNTCGAYDVLVVAGGDGTLNEVINGIAERQGQPKIGYLPMGTVNDVGHSLNISRSVKKALDIILTGKGFKHDIFKVNDRYGIYVCCAGVFTETSYATSQNAKRAFGKVAYGVHALKSAFKTQPMDTTLSFSGGIIKARLAFFLALNSRNVASFGVNRKAKLNDGKIDVMLVKNPTAHIGVLGMGRVLKLFLFGLHSDKNTLRLRLNQFEATFEKPPIINVDGEKSGEGNFKLSVLKEGVEIFVK